MNGGERDRIWDSAEKLNHLAAWAQGGDELAWNQLFTIIQRPLFRLSVHFRVPLDDVDDLVQETILLLYRKLDQFDPRRASFRVWATAILRNRAITRFRRRRRETQGLQRYVQTLSRASHGDLRADVRLLEALDTLDAYASHLSERELEVLSLCKAEDLTAAEAGRILKITPGRVRGALSTALARLRRAVRADDERRDDASAR